MVVYSFFHKGFFVLGIINLFAHAVYAFFYKIASFFAIKKSVVKKNFAGFISADFFNNSVICFFGIFCTCAFKLACSYIAETNSKRVIFHKNACDIVVCAFFKHCVFNNGSGSDDTDYVAFYKAFCKRGIFHLFTDCYFIAFFYKTGNIRFVTVIRNSTHWRSFFLTAISSGKGKLQFFGSDFCIVKKHFVKVTEPEKQYGVFVILFYFKILFHHRRKLCQKTHFPIIIYIYYIIT